MKEIKYRPIDWDLYDSKGYEWYAFEQIKPTDIVKCRRYGIIGIHCDKTE